MLKSVKIILTTLSNQGTAEDVLQLSPLNILPGREPRWIVDKKKGKTKSYLFKTLTRVNHQNIFVNLPFVVKFSPSFISSTSTSSFSPLTPTDIFLTIS